MDDSSTGGFYGWQVHLANPAIIAWNGRAIARRSQRITMKHRNSITKSDFFVAIMDSGDPERFRRTFESTRKANPDAKIIIQNSEDFLECATMIALAHGDIPPNAYKLYSKAKIIWPIRQHATPQ